MMKPASYNLENVEEVEGLRRTDYVDHSVYTFHHRLCSRIADDAVP
ncbi:MAG: hypothetical protein ACI4AH_05095 [Muribaculaceae bacterium]